MLSETKSRARAAMLAIAMNAATVDPLDFFRFLRVPAIVLLLRRRTAARSCREKHLRRTRITRWR